MRIKYCPYEHKYELVNWLVKDRGWKHHKANKLLKNQLYAIWYKISDNRVSHYINQ